MIKCIGFDLDGVLRHDFKHERKGQAIDGAIEVVEHLKTYSVDIFVATNQAGPTWAGAYARNGNMGKAKKYPSGQEVAWDIASFARSVNLFDVPWYIAVYDARIKDVLSEDLADPDMELQIIYNSAAGNLQWDLQNLPDARMPKVEVSANPLWRKPEGGMIAHAATDLGHIMSTVLYVGDMDTDREAAEKAGCQFFDVRERPLKDILAMIQ
jgi:FMN phosphatase YigB (HAD superfamily)